MKLWVKLKRDLDHIELVFDTQEYYQLNILIANAGYGDWKVVDWRLKEIEFIKI